MRGGRRIVRVVPDRGVSCLRAAADFYHRYQHTHREVVGMEEGNKAKRQDWAAREGNGRGENAWLLLYLCYLI